VTIKAMKHHVLCAILILRFSCASALRVAQMRTDLLDISTSTKSEEIPRIIHMVWISSRLGTQPPRKFDDNRKKFQELHPNWEVKLWTDESCQKLLAEDYPWFAPTYDKLKTVIIKVDSMKYAVLHKYGGVYVDMDMIPSFNIENVTQGTHAMMILDNNDEKGGNINNNFMGSVSGHPFFLDMLHTIGSLAELPVRRHNKYADTLCLTGWMVTTPIWKGKYKGKMEGEGEMNGAKYAVYHSNDIEAVFGIHHQMAGTWVPKRLDKVLSEEDYTYQQCERNRPGYREVLNKVIMQS